MEQSQRTCNEKAEELDQNRTEALQFQHSLAQRDEQIRSLEDTIMDLNNSKLSFEEDAKLQAKELADEVKKLQQKLVQVLLSFVNPWEDSRLESYQGPISFS